MHEDFNDEQSDWETNAAHRKRLKDSVLIAF